MLDRERVVVWDLDGTLADNRHRLKYLPRGSSPHCCRNSTRAEIEKFMDPKLIIKDRPKIAEAYTYTDLPSIICTARWESLENVTREWLHRHYPNLARVPIFMRPDWDERPSIQVKGDIFWLFSGFWIDDDPEMIVEAQKAGFHGIQVY